MFQSSFSYIASVICLDNPRADASSRVPSQKQELFGFAILNSSNKTIIEERNFGR